MYLEECFEKLCQDDFSRRDKFNQWQVIQKLTSQKLHTVCTHFPHFSIHDATHSETIGVQIGRLLGQERINKISCSDFLLMLASFYLHDIGMALEYDEIYEKLTSAEFQDILKKISNDDDSELQTVAKRLCGFSSICNYEHSIDVYNDVVVIIESLYRSQHAARSSKYIMGNEEIKRCFGIRCQKILADICDMHQKAIAEIMKLPQIENGLFDDYVHPRFLAAMLCLGDLLDLDTERFDEEYLKASPPMPRMSRLHKEKHESVERFLVDKDGIYLKSDTSKIDVYREIRQWYDWIQKTCDFIALHWSEISPNDFGNAPRFIERNLLLNGRIYAEELVDLHYEVDGKRLFGLLKGSGFYRSKIVCIREVLQNAIDATIFRLFDEGILHGSHEEILEQVKSLNWEFYQIEGEIIKKNDTQVNICIKDKGIGISLDDVYKIAHVSQNQTVYKKKLLDKMPQWLRPSGAFGIGLQSIFLLADEFSMITKTIDEPPKKITFQSADGSNGYIIVEHYPERVEQGTKVFISVDVSKMTADELGCSNYYYRRNLLSDSFLKKVMIEYSNRLRSSIPSRDFRKKEFSDVPVKISITDFRNGNLTSLLHWEPFFASELDKIDICCGNLNTSFFFEDLNCYIKCHMGLHSQSSNVHTYGTIDRGVLRFNNTVFYRHEYVLDGCLERFGIENVPVLPYVDWCIDILDEKADDILSISRNDVKEEYAKPFYSILLATLERTIKKIIDYLLVTDKYKKAYMEIGDTILLIYQFANQYEYREEELLSGYKDRMSEIHVNNYIKWPGKENCSFTLDELIKADYLYFVIDEIDKNLLPEEVSVSSLEKKNLLFCLTADIGVHILNHRAIKVRVAKVEDRYIEMVEVIPFAYLNPLKHALKMDDLPLRRQILRMIKMSIRGLPGLEGYEDLITPVNSESFSIRSYVRTDTYIIELPFEKYLDAIYNDLKIHGFLPDADDYFQRIIVSEEFLSNLEYIRLYHNQNVNLDELYKRLIRKVFDLLKDEKYKKINEYFLSKYNDSREEQYVFNGRDILDANPYLSSVISVQNLK